MTKENKNNPGTCDALGRKEEHKPVESNTTAAWAEIEKQKSEGKVPIPSIENVEEAKEWVEENKK